MTHSTAGAAQPTRLDRRGIVAGAVGNVLEWYDFAVYGFMAPIIGKAFFPSDDPFASLLAAYGVFAVGYAVRPIGSVLLGHIGDRIGRKPALVLSVAIMGLASLLIGLLPSHAAIGTSAALLLMLLRTVQGLVVAGEFAASSVLLVERAPAARRGWVGSWVNFAGNSGFLLGSAVAALVSNLMSAAALQDWGWRLPFLLGAGIAVYALVLRRGMAESPVMQSATPAPRLPAVEALRHHWGAILRLVCIVMPTAVVYYIVFVFAASFLTQQMHISTARALDINTAALILLVVTCPVAGLASDRFGRRRALFFTTLGNVLLAWPLWYALHIDSLAWILVGQLGFAFINGVGWSQVVPLMVELMPARVRCTAAGIGYNVCLALFGGATPWVATYLISRTADDFAPAYYAMAVSAIAFIAALRMPETAGRPLRE